MTQQPNKIKVDTDAGAPDCTLQLDLVRIDYEHKLVNSKMYDEQLNLTRSSNTNKLFKITKKCKELK